MKTRKDHVREGNCINGDGRPICSPSAVLCRECLDGLSAKFEKLADLFDNQPGGAR